METEELNSSVQEWIIDSNLSKYVAISAFRELGTVDWTQSANFAVGDIVYIYISSPDQALRIKCQVKQVDKLTSTIEDSKYAFDEKYMAKENGHYVELEMIEELEGELYTSERLVDNGFIAPKEPYRVTEELKEYLNVVDTLKTAEEMDPDKYDGSYELMKSVINSYENMKDRSAIDYNDLNLVYAMVIGTWCQGIGAKKKITSQSHLPDDQKDVVRRKLDGGMEEGW